MPETQKVTEEQAGVALHELLHANTTDDGGENPVGGQAEQAATAYRLGRRRHRWHHQPKTTGGGHHKGGTQP